jgi:DNA/RNA endonuclease G (NUC1)
MADNTHLHPSSVPLSHLLDLFLFKGAPVNNDPDRAVTVLINHGYVVGFSRDRLQPLWAAYRVAGGSGLSQFERPMMYYADERLGQTERLDNRAFGTRDGVQYHVGHMVPNAAIDGQFGRLAQMETFFMSNMSPQWGSLNTGVWKDLETRIRNVEDSPEREQIWAITGPVFGEDPPEITRDDGKVVQVPEAYYCITVDPFGYPYDRPGNQDIACFLIPQHAPRRTPLEEFITTLEVIEERTKLRFMPGWSQEVAREEARAAVRAMRGMRGATRDAGMFQPRSVEAIVEAPAERHRLLRQL